jgi:hypothetical protein
MGLIFVSLAREPGFIRIPISGGFVHETYLQSSQHVYQHPAVEHWLRIDGCNHPVDLLKRKALKKTKMLKIERLLIPWHKPEVSPEFLALPGSAGPRRS